MPPRLDPAEFDRRSERAPNGCLLWIGPRCGGDQKTPDRVYGLWGRHKYAHREAYERAYGPIPDGLVVMHSCDTPLCVEPSHLRAGTQSENLHDASARGRTEKGPRPCSTCGGPKKTSPSGAHFCTPCSTARMAAYRKAR